MNCEDLEGEFLQYASIVKLTEGQEMTPAEMSAAITAIRAGVDVFKGIKDLNNKAASLEADRAILSMDRALFELEKELLAKDKEIAQLKEQLALVEKPKYVDQLIAKNSHWFVKDDESQIPVCRNCTDKANRIIYAIKTGIGNQCPECKAPI